MQPPCPGYRAVSCNVNEFRDIIPSFSRLEEAREETPLLTRQRKTLILKKLKKDGQIVAKDVSRQLALSEDTIRRDLRELAQEGLLQRVHGGALPASPAVADFAGRERITTEGKVAIGRAAAKLIQPGQVV